MPRENVDLARTIIEVWNQAGPEGISRYSTDEVEYHDPPSLPDAKVIRGRDAVAAHLAGNSVAVGKMQFTVKQALPVGDDRVVLLMDLEVQGAGSGIEMSGPFAQVMDMVDGRLRRTRSFLTWDEALEAAGLSE